MTQEEAQAKRERERERERQRGRQRRAEQEQRRSRAGARVGARAGAETGSGTGAGAEQSTACLRGSRGTVAETAHRAILSRACSMEQNMRQLHHKERVAVVLPPKAAGKETARASCGQSDRLSLAAHRYEAQTHTQSHICIYVYMC
jgi:hypothetical protein